MALELGASFGPYEIVALLGAGGMGEVYRAHDAKLQRDVALKILPERFASDPARVTRFEREARALAALNHPNVAQIFGFQEDQGRHAFVMELVEGRPLDQQLADARTRGRGLGLNLACEIAGQIAEAIEAAHTHGILHRDLKPANVIVSSDAVVKVLDFGLATARTSAESAPSLATLTAVTEAGMAIGTPAYMSPEQARGEAVDRRTDVWAFGCLLFEMLAGVRAFDGRTSSDIMAAVLTREPDWSRLPATVPSGLKRVLRRCLQKDAAQRLRDLGDARLEIEDALVDPDARPMAPGILTSGVRNWMAALSVLTLVAIVAAYTGWRFRPATPVASPMRRFAFGLSPSRDNLILNQAGVPFALMRDGSRLVIAAGSWQGSQLYVASFDGGPPSPVSGTLSAFNPFVSPDGRWIAFIAGNFLKKVPAAGGPVVTIGETAGASLNGADWTPEGIFFSLAHEGRGIEHVSPDGGEPRQVTSVDSAKGEAWHDWPNVLPDGRTILFTVRLRDRGQQVVAQRLGTGERTTVMQGASRARYLSSGHLVYAQGTQLHAVPFDPARLEITGTPVVIATLVAGDGTQFDIADDGTLVHRPAVDEAQRSLVWVDRQGRRTPMSSRLGRFMFPNLSPDGRRVAVIIPERDLLALWLYRPDTDSLLQLASNMALDNAIWTRDSESVVYPISDQMGYAMVQHPAGAAVSHVLFRSTGRLWPGSWSPDGRHLAYMIRGPSGGDIGVFDRVSSEQTLFLQSTATEWGARLSPDQRVMAYVSNESGRWEVYVQPFPGPGTPMRISAEGGTEVVWARDGRELYYRVGPRLIAVEIDQGATFSIGRTSTLFNAPLALGQPGLPNYDVAADGRFVMVEPGPDEPTTQTLQVTLNWPSLLK